jgi:hypothetical protein
MHAEIRGRGRSWKVWTPDASHRAHQIPLYGEDGTLKEMLTVGTPPDREGTKFVECYGGPFSSMDEAIDYARYLGFENVTVIQTKTKQQALARARAARSRQKED